MNTDESQEIWQVESGGRIFEGNFTELTSWINDSSLLRIDRVRKGNLRWIEAGKVPSLAAVFNAKESGEPPLPPVITLTKLGPTSLPGEPAGNPPNYSVTPVTESVVQPIVDEPVCSMHPDVPAAFICETCCNQFCKACPNSYGGNVKICPFCGAMCKPLPKPEPVQAEFYYPEVGGFGFGDFVAALAYPFKFKASLIIGAIMFMFLSLGQGAVSVGGIFMMWGAIASFMLANTLTFGILANTVENFSQGKVGENFMPSFDDFSLWDDVVHPFFLMIGVYISSFGPLLAVVLVAVFMITGTVKNEMNDIQPDTARIINPQLPYAANAAKQSEKVREILKQDIDRQKQRAADFEAQQERIMSAVESGEELNEQTLPRPLMPNELDEQRIADLQKMMEESRKAQLESVVGRTPEMAAKDTQALVARVLGYGLAFILIGGVCFLWGIFYFPAACAVAGYTRSFGATLNPTIGLDTIRRLGLDYVKILLMGLCLATASGVIGGTLAIVFSPLDLPGVGNLPATAIGSLFGFYFSVVFSCVIGFALYKGAERLRLYR